MYETILAKYLAYVDTYRSADGMLPEMMQLKLDHTMRVVENATLVAKTEGFSDELLEASRIAALLHDTGRYEQLKRYNTFRDSDSVDHAVFSHDIVLEKGWIDDRAILDAVLFHNRRDLPEGMDERTAALAKIVRDADKLDIFRVLEERIAVPNWMEDRRAFWNLEIKGEPSVEVTAAIAEGRPVDYQHIRNLADFVLIQVGWIKNGLYYETSRNLAKSRGHLDKRLELLRSLCETQPV